MSQINKPNEYFNTVLYTGNGSTQSITGLDFQPDFTWIKGRSDVIAHVLFDSVRGAGGNKELGSNVTYAEGGNSSISYGFLSSFNSDGFSVSQGTSSPNQADYTNKNSSTYASWNWLAGGTGVSNTDGSITSTVSANTTSGFSIVSYTGNGTTVSTVGHGLGVKPSMIIVKNRTTTGKQWTVYNSYLTATSHIYLQSTQGVGTYSGYWNNTEPTTSVFTVGNDENNFVNGSTDNFIAYCFAEKKGFSKFGSYVGNGSTNGTFVFTGMKPAFVMIKQTNASGEHWTIRDNKRQSYNLELKTLFANLSNAENTGSTYGVDLLSNGFKCRDADVACNSSGSTYIYMAFAENPLVGTNNVPATAR